MCSNHQYSPNVWRFYTGEAGCLYHGVWVRLPDLELDRFVITVRLDNAHVLFILGSDFLVLLSEN